jgi:transposase
MDTEHSRKRRRRYDAAVKAQIVAQCDEPGASVANVAMAHGINANIVHGWRKLARQANATGAPVRFVPVTVAPSGSEPVDQRSIEVELRRGSITVKLRWPMSGAMDLSAWMRELLR